MLCWYLLCLGTPCSPGKEKGSVAAPQDMPSLPGLPGPPCCALWKHLRLHCALSGSGCGKSEGGGTQIKPIKVARRNYLAICVDLGQVCREEVLGGGVVKPVCRYLGMVLAAAEVLYLFSYQETSSALQAQSPFCYFPGVQYRT